MQLWSKATAQSPEPAAIVNGPVTLLLHSCLSKHQSSQLMGLDSSFSQRIDGALTPDLLWWLDPETAARDKLSTGPVGHEVFFAADTNQSSEAETQSSCLISRPLFLLPSVHLAIHHTLPSAAARRASPLVFRRFSSSVRTIKGRRCSLCCVFFVRRPQIEGICSI